MGSETRLRGRTTLGSLGDTQIFDVCIIGSGPAGTVLGRSLAAQGVRTIIVESGSSVLRWLSDRRVQHLADIDYTGDTDYPLKRTKARALGGNSNFWTGRCERFHPSDFGSHPYSVPDNPWPIGYGDLDPHYEAAERLLRVRGGPRSSFAPPRSQPFPFPTKTDITSLREIAQRAGVQLDDSPTATPSKTLRFFRVQRELLPEFLHSPDAAVVAGATVTRLLAGPDGVITGAEARSLDGVTRTVRARIFVVCCGGMETPRLLLLSRSEFHPDGIGNRYDRVGRGFNEHPAVNFYGTIEHTAGTLLPTNKIGRTHQFYDRFRSEGLGSVLPVFRQSWVLPHHNMPFRPWNIPRNAFNFGRRLARAALYIGVVAEMRISDSNRVTLSRSKKDAFGQPLAHLMFHYAEDDLRLLDASRKLVRGWYAKIGARGIFEDLVSWSRHHQGTCRMGVSPQSSVVDPNLRVHDTQNLYVCGSEAFVTGGAMQPCLTIVALAHRLGEHLPRVLREGGAPAASENSGT
jgi:glucose dehydrogenase